MIVEVCKSNVCYPGESRGESEVPTGTLTIVEVS